ncbi:hypothetical protein [Alicyclobacillus shizuokensis]|uniref:hypothetical protein n=1 Tax=Alicyclobacillus shizuokensis TaxID=392014 RepID=UPI0008316376|nr:hypothetical protein [Alicyclobacillus shizuokensis]MCL6625339.1 hypothetical protein [Alicyclobacillus shizuokensis]
MKILVCQPIHEKGTDQLEDALQNNECIDTVLFPEGYLASEGLVTKACELARAYHRMIITGYRDHHGKNRALIIGGAGEILLDRAKTPKNHDLLSPSVVECSGFQIGYLLCRELFQGFKGLEKLGASRLHLIAHPIDVGMFSEEQFEQWIGEARRIAMKYQTTIIGTSHGDGSFRNCGVSIPIAYCIGPNGDSVFISKDDARSRTVDTGMRFITGPLANHVTVDASRMRFSLF